MTVFCINKGKLGKKISRNIKLASSCPPSLQNRKWCHYPHKLQMACITTTTKCTGRPTKDIMNAIKNVVLCTTFMYSIRQLLPLPSVEKEVLVQYNM